MLLLLKDDIKAFHKMVNETVFDTWFVIYLCFNLKTNYNDSFFSTIVLDTKPSSNALVLLSFYIGNLKAKHNQLYNFEFVILVD